MADLNSPAAPIVRQPRGAIKINGTLVWGWTSFDVDNNRHNAADTFKAELAVGGLPAAFNAAWFATQTSIRVELFATDKPSDPANYNGPASDSLILGQVDHIDFDPAEGTISLSGRDLTALLIDTKTSENHQNQTSSAVATLLAQRHGLTPIVTATTTRIGQFYEIDHTDINQQQSEWDLLLRLADFEGFDVFVKGNSLYFQPKAQDNGDRYAIVWTPPTDDSAAPLANTTTLKFSRDLTIAKGVTVEVRSWNAKQKKAFTATWPKAVKHIKPGQSSNDNLTYHFHVAGLTQDQASAKAQAFYNQIVQHMVQLDADLPADSVLTCNSIIAVRGTGTAFDQSYYPSSVKRSLSATEGYRMTVSGKNISEEVENAEANAS